jgi:hypothetical protein
MEHYKNMGNKPAGFPFLPASAERHDFGEAQAAKNDSPAENGFTGNKVSVAGGEKAGSGGGGGGGKADGLGKAGKENAKKVKGAKVGIASTWKYDSHFLLGFRV